MKHIVERSFIMCKSTLPQEYNYRSSGHLLSTSFMTIGSAAKIIRLYAPATLEKIDIKSATNIRTTCVRFVMTASLPGPLSPFQMRLSLLITWTITPPTTVVQSIVPM